jgi:hypothetical protein
MSLNDDIIAVAAALVAAKQMEQNATQASLEAWAAGDGVILAASIYTILDMDPTKTELIQEMQNNEAIAGQIIFSYTVPADRLSVQQKADLDTLNAQTDLGSAQRGLFPQLLTNAAANSEIGIRFYLYDSTAQTLLLRFIIRST